MSEVLLIELMVDRDGEVALAPGLTLGGLEDAVRRALSAGIPLETPLEYGYSRNDLADGVMVTKLIDLTSLGTDALRQMATSRDKRESSRAWDEIERRIRNNGGSSAGA